MDEQSLRLLADIKLSLAKLEVRIRNTEAPTAQKVAPEKKHVYNLFEDESSTPPVADKPAESPKREDDDFVELDRDALDLIDMDNNQPVPDIHKFHRQKDIEESISRQILQALEEADPEQGLSADDVTEAVELPSYRIKKVMKKLWKEDKIETVHMRPKTYRLAT
jgi:hypothetical protein